MRNMRLFLALQISLVLLSFNTYAQCGLNENEYNLEIITTSNPDNAFWSLKSSSGSMISFGFQLSEMDTFQESFCLKDDNYFFTFDQMGTSSWSGSYSITGPAGSNSIIGTGYNASQPAMFLAQGLHPCQDFSGTVNYNLPPDAGFTSVGHGDTLEICYSLNLEADLFFPNNNTDYNQSADNVTYLWEANNPSGVSTGQTSDLNSAYFEFDDHLTYQVNLTVTDTNDCSWGHEFFVKNISDNTYIELTVDDDVICVGETTTVRATYTETFLETEVIEIDPVFLDDVVGGEYESVISINHYGANDVLTADCIERVCAQLEHTWVGDLTIFLELPNGQQVDFLPDLNGTGAGNGFGNVNFGVPVGGTEPGTPWQYCWTPTAGFNMHDYEDNLSPTTFPETVINADGTFTNDYNANDASGNGWDNQIGSPINGDWTMHIIDTWGGDDGYIFGWNFELCFDPTDSSFEPDSFWVGPAGSFVTTADEDSLNRDIIGVETSDGQMVFEYHRLDRFGCEWVEDITVTTIPLPIIDQSTTVKCNSIFEIGVLDTAQITGTWTYDAPDGVTDPVIFDPSVTDLTPLITVPEIGIYEFHYTSECGVQQTQIINFESFLPADVDIEYDTVNCDSEYQLAAGNATGTNGEWVYLGPPGSIGDVVFTPDAFALTPSVTVPVLGSYDFSYLTECGITAAQTVAFVSEAPELDILTFQNCDYEIDLNAVNTDGKTGVWTVITPTGETAVIADVNATSTTATVSNYGQYTFTFTYDFCEASFSETIDVNSVAPIILNDKILYTCESEIALEASVEGQIVGWQIVSGPGIVNFSSFDDVNTNAEFLDYGSYEIQFEGCGGFDTITIVFEKQAPYISSPNYVECGLQALVEVDFLGSTGVWSVEAVNNENIQMDVQSNPNQVIVSSDIYGSAEITYSVCDTFATQEIFFMCELDVPNVFTPNGDAYNNYFTIPRLTSTVYDKSVFVVYNRWGVEVYRNGQYGLKGGFWDGRETNTSGEILPDGVYFYELDLHNRVNDLNETYKGTINLFR